MKRIIYITVALLSAVSCSKQVPSSEVRTLLSVGTATKVGINDDLQTIWHHNDSVAVFYNGTDATVWTFDGQTGSTSGDIGSYGSFAPLSHATAVLPYAKGVSLSGNAISTVIPSSVVYDGFSTAFAVMVADSDSQPLVFNYASALVSLVLNAGTDFEIETITLSGGCSEPLCGTASTSALDPSLKVTGSGTVLTLNVPQQYSALSGTAVFNFGIPPGTYPSGIRFAVCMKDGSVFNVESSTSFTVGAGQLKTVSCDICRQETTMFDLNFTTSTCPFRYKSSGLPVSGKHMTSDAGDVFVATGADSKEYDFVIFSQNEGYYQLTKSPYWFRLSTGSGETGSGPCWMKLPIVENRVLSSIGLKLSNTSAGNKGFYICDRADDSDPLVTIKVAITEGVEPEEVLTYIPTSSTGDYYMYGRGNAKCAQITRLVLNYE